MFVIRKPESTKKRSTPMKPPTAALTPPWKMTTA
jgi:hypothetical protein